MTEKTPGSKKPLGLLVTTWKSDLHTFHAKEKALNETWAGTEKWLEAI